MRTSVEKYRTMLVPLWILHSWWINTPGLRNQAELVARHKVWNMTGLPRWIILVPCPCLMTPVRAPAFMMGPSSLLFSQLIIPSHMTSGARAPWVRHTNGQGASNPGAPCSPFSPLGPFLPFFPFSPCGYKGLNKRQVLLEGVSNGDSNDDLANKSLEGHLPLFSGLGKAWHYKNSRATMDSG